MRRMVRFCWFMPATNSSVTAKSGLPVSRRNTRALSYGDVLAIVVVDDVAQLRRTVLAAGRERGDVVRAQELVLLRRQHVGGFGQ